MARADPVDLPKQHLSLALPRHLCELVHGSNQQSRRAAVDVFIHDHHWQALFRSLGLREFAPPEAVATVSHAAANIAWCFVHSEVHLANLCSAPRAGRYLVRRSTHVWPTAHAALSQRFGSRGQRVWCGVATNPKSESEIRRAPFLLVAATN